MTITCPSCGQSVPSDRINITNAIAQCSCGHIFGFASQVPQSKASSSKAPVAMPKGFDVSMDPLGAFVLRHRWFSAKYIALAVFCVFWDAFILFFIAMMLKQGKFHPGMLLILVHAGVGVGLTYGVLAGFLNSTWFTISHDALIIRQGPVPVGGNRRVERYAIKQLYCEKKKHRGKHGVRYTYQVIVAEQSGQKTTLVKNLDDLSQARYIEQQLENQMGIKDVVMPDEAV